MASRVTKVGQRVLAQPTANARVTLVGQRVLIRDWVTPGQSSDVTFLG